MTEERVRHKHTILVVEDESLIRFGLVDILETEGFATREAASAMQAIEILKADEAIDIVLTDIEMPGSMDGLALSHYIRRRWPPTLIIVTSGRKSPAESELPKGAAFLSKPHHPIELARLLDWARSSLG